MGCAILRVKRRERSGLLGPGCLEIFDIRHRLFPFNPAEADCCMDEKVAWGSAVPVPDTAWCPDDVTGADPDRTIGVGHNAFAGDHDQDLATIMGMPMRPRTGCEQNLTEGDALRFGQEGVAPNRAPGKGVRPNNGRHGPIRPNNGQHDASQPPQKTNSPSTFMCTDPFSGA